MAPPCCASRAAGTPGVPYAAEARWSPAVSLKLQGRWDESLEVLVRETVETLVYGD